MPTISDNEPSPYDVGFLCSKCKDNLETLNDLRSDHPDANRLLAQSLDLDRQILATPARDVRNLIEKIEFLVEILDIAETGEKIQNQAHVCLFLAKVIYPGITAHGLVVKIGRLIELLDPEVTGDYVADLAASCLADAEAMAAC
jgi:hypothetical protein